MREVRIYNTLGGHLVPLRPLSPPRVSMFVCGITPYKPSHIGHARAAIVYDVVAKFLRRVGYHVFYLQNVTDIDDKILRTATEEGRDWHTVSEENFESYLRAMQHLHVDSVNFYARCTDYIAEIIEQVRTLIEKGHAYASGGDVYYDVGTFPAFGALSGQRLEMLEAGVRVEVNPNKRSPEDFALWKGEKLGPRWSSPWGEGRPGWHIEDTAIAVNILGPRYDIHGGGMELKFPHHEAEIAQAEAATGKAPLASIWMHHNMLNMRGEKMSKSLGNVVSLDATLRRVSPEVLRYFLLSAHYRSPLDYAGEESLEEARRSLQTLQVVYARLRAQAEESLGGTFPREVQPTPGSRVYVRDLAEWIELVPRIYMADPEHQRGDRVEEDMMTALANDFSVREATASLFSFASEVHALLESRGPSLREEELASLVRPFVLATEVLGYFPREGTSGSNAPLAAAIELVIEARARAKEHKDFAEADRIRKTLSEAGIEIEDTGRGTRWRIRS